MIKTLFITLALSATAASSCWAGPKVLFETTMGNFTVELNEEKAPISSKNFLQYVDDKHYDGVIFHRVIEDFMIQTGGFTLENGSLNKKDTRDPIQNEAKNGLKNDKGTIAMARTSDPHSASAQFFINHKDSDFLNYPGQDGWGYAVFGKVVEGMDVVDKIAAVETGRSPEGMSDVPKEPITIKSAKRVDE